MSFQKSYNAQPKGASIEYVDAMVQSILHCTYFIFFLWFIQLCVHILIFAITILITLVQTSLVKLTCNSKPERWSALLFDCSWFYCIGIQDLTVLYLFYYDTYLNLKSRRWEISMAKSFSGSAMSPISSSPHLTTRSGVSIHLEWVQLCVCLHPW